jgi:hypothetical protein
MAEENSTSVRITNVQVYEKLMEVNENQIEMFAELRGLKYLPNRLSKVELIARLVYGVYGAMLGAVGIALVGLLGG